MTAKPHEPHDADRGADPESACPLIDDDARYPNRREHDGDILRTVRAIKEGQDRLHLKLFGEVETETEHGRIPRLEAKVGTDNDRIKSLERWRWLLVGGGVAVWALLQFLNALAKAPR